MSRRRLRPAIDLVNAIGAAAADLSAHGDDQARGALALCAQVNPEAFPWLRDRLLDITRQPDGLHTPPLSELCQMLGDLRTLEVAGLVAIESDAAGVVRCRPTESSS